MGISSANPSENDGLRDDSGQVRRGAAKDSKTSTFVLSRSGNCPGADVDLRGHGGTTPAEVLNNLPSLVDPAACASQRAAEFLGSQSNP